MKEQFFNGHNECSSLDPFYHLLSMIFPGQTAPPSEKTSDEYEIQKIGDNAFALKPNQEALSSKSV